MLRAGRRGGTPSPGAARRPPTELQGDRARRALRAAGCGADRPGTVPGEGMANPKRIVGSRHQLPGALLDV
jgi:hypothetical protein